MHQRDATSRFKRVFFVGMCLWVVTFLSCTFSQAEMQILSLRMGGPARLRFIGIGGYIYCQYRSTNVEPAGASMSPFSEWEGWGRDDFFGPFFDPEWRCYAYNSPTFAGWEIAFPHWLVLIPLTGMILWARVRLAQLIKRVSMGFCRVCGYDLRASPQRCPECGTPRTPATPAPQGAP